MKVIPNSAWINRNSGGNNIEHETDKLPNRDFGRLAKRQTGIPVDRKTDKPFRQTGKTVNRQTGWKRTVEVASIGVQQVEMSHVGREDRMELTIDAGAGENVMPEYMAPNTPVMQSKEAGVVYTAANGDTMPNRGRKVVKVTTNEGQSKSMNMQITDVNRALMSVAKICDAGHTVMFRDDGGVIRNNKTGEETKFRRENNVYRMTVKLNDVGFARQG